MDMMSVRSYILSEYSENGAQRGLTPKNLYFLVDKLILHDIII